ncbi:MAG: hypothetical protein GY720_16630 [bacterium]|nr:hypothetical protein [bacterium]
MTTTARPTTTTTSPAPPTTTTTAPPTSVSEDARAVVMAGFGGTELDAATEAHLTEGGRAVILFSRNLVDPDQLTALTASIACAAAAPVIVAVDQEPGRVDRLADVGVPAPPLDSQPGDFSAASATMATAMLELGINLDLAPIVDVAQGENPVLEGRNLGPDPAVVIERAVDFIEALDTAGVGTTAKHFPGHGLSRVDPHRDVTIIDASMETLLAEHFPPFTAAIDAGVSTVMVGHPVYEAIDPNQPASLSPVVLAMLRDDFGFEGVAITDGLSMAALRKVRTIEQIAIEAMQAGQDLLLADRPSDVPRLVDTIVAAVTDGTLDRSRLGEAAERVRRLADSLAPVNCPAS